MPVCIPLTAGSIQLNAVTQGRPHAKETVAHPLMNRSIISYLALIGPNRAGKTSTFQAILGLVAHRGRVALDGKVLTGLPAWTRQNRGLGYVPEGRRWFGDMAVEEIHHPSPRQRHPAGRTKRAQSAGLRPARLRSRGGTAAAERHR